MKHEIHKKKTVSALKWNAINQMVTQMFTLGIGILLMRLIEPEEFGLLGMVAVFTGFMNVIANFGLATSLIQKKEVDELDKSTIFYVNLVVGIFLTLLLFFSSTYIAKFYNTPELTRIAKYLSILFTTQAFGMIPSTMLRREMNYRLMFFMNLFASVTSGSLAIYLALHDFGVWTLVYQQLTASILTTVVLWYIIRWYPKLIFSYDRLKQHMGFSLPLFGTNTLNYWSRNADNLLIGKFLGAGALGMYSKAYALMMLPLTKISSVISSVMLSSFSLIQDDKERIKTIYLKISRVIAFITFPMMGILFVVAKPLVAFAFGDKWMGIVDLLKILSFVGALQSIVVLNGNIFISQGKTIILFKVRIITNILTILAFLIAIQFGINAVAIAYLITNVIIFLPVQKVISTIIDLTIKEFLINLQTHFISLIVLVFANIFLLKHIDTYPDFIQIIIISIIFLFGWFISFRIFNKKILKEFNIIKKELI